MQQQQKVDPKRKPLKWAAVGCVLAGLALLLGGCAAKVQKSGFLSDYSKLEPVGGSESFMRYSAPSATLDKYRSIILEPITVHFYEHADSGKIDPKDAKHLEQVFYEALKTDLTAADFKLVTEPGPGVARLRIAFTDLKKGTPALNVLPQTKLTGLGLGQASVEGEFLDSVSGEQLFAAIKSDTGSRFSLSGLSEWGDVEALCKEWSKSFVARLSEARAKRQAAPASAP